MSQASFRQILIQADAQIEASSKAGGLRSISPRNRSAPAVEALLASGTIPVQKSKSGSTALHLAVQTTGRGGSGTDIAKKHQLRIIELLLEHGARATDQDGSGKTVRAIVKGTLEQLLP